MANPHHTYRTLSSKAAQNTTVVIHDGKAAVVVDLILRQPKLRLRPDPGGLGHIVTAAFFGATWCGDQAIVANLSEPYSHCTAGQLPPTPPHRLLFDVRANDGNRDDDDDDDADPWPGQMGRQTYNGLDLGFTLAVPLHVPEDFPPPPVP